MSWTVHSLLSWPCLPCVQPRDLHTYIISSDFVAHPHHHPPASHLTLQLLPHHVQLLMDATNHFAASILASRLSCSCWPSSSLDLAFAVCCIAVGCTYVSGVSCCMAGSHRRPLRCAPRQPGTHVCVCGQLPDICRGTTNKPPLHCLTQTFSGGASLPAPLCECSSVPAHCVPLILPPPCPNTCATVQHSTALHCTAPVQCDQKVVPLCVCWGEGRMRLLNCHLKRAPRLHTRIHLLPCVHSLAASCISFRSKSCLFHPHTAAALPCDTTNRVSIGSLAPAANHTS